MIRQIDHIAIAVRDLEAQIGFYQKALGLPLAHREEVAEQKVKVAMFRLGEVRLELLEPTSPESPIAKFLEKNGEGLHHLAYRVDDVAQTMEHFQQLGIRLLNEVPREGAEGARIAFAHPKSTGGVLTELVERKEKD